MNAEATSPPIGSAELAVQPWHSKLDLVRETVAQGATDAEFDLFLHTAMRRGLDPLAKQIYYVKRQGKGTIQVGIDGLRAIAHRGGLCAGISDATFEDSADGKQPLSATVTVHRVTEGKAYPYTATARWVEYFPGDAQGFQWKRMPFAMLAKCAEALALRKAFPEDMGGLYEPAEMDQAGDVDAINTESVDLSHTVTDADRKQAAVEASKEQGVPLGRDNQPVKPIAFGYSPALWPLPATWGKPATEIQAKKAKEYAESRRIDAKLLPLLSAAVAREYCVDPTKQGTASLVIDWLKNADDDALAIAVASLDAPKEEADGE